MANIKKKTIDTYLIVNGIKPVTVGGNSMMPTIHIKDKIWVIPKNSYKIGDIIVFWNNDQLTIHRIVFAFNNRFVAKGDNVSTIDGCFSYDSILGCANIDNRHQKMKAFISIADSIISKLIFWKEYESMRMLISKLYSWLSYNVRKVV